MSKKLILITAGCVLLISSVVMFYVFKAENKAVPAAIIEQEKKPLTADEIIGLILEKNTIPKSYLEYKSATGAGSRKAETLMKVWHNPAQKQMRREITDGPDKNITLIDGKNIYYYKEGEKRAYVIGNEEAADKDKLVNDEDPTQEAVENSLVVYIRRNKNNYDIKYNGEEIIAERNTYHISAVLKSDNKHSVNVWADVETGILVKAEMKSKRKTIRMQLSKLDLTPTFSENTFKLDLPKGVEIVKQ